MRSEKSVLLKNKKRFDKLLEDKKTAWRVT